LIFSFPRALWLFVLAFAFLVPAHAGASDGPTVFQIPSQMPSGDAVNDQIWFTYYRAVSASGPVPSVVILHPIGAATGDLSDRDMQRLAGSMAARGISCAVMELPYHEHRHTLGTDSVAHFIDPKRYDVVQALSQGASDVSTVAQWLGRQTGADPSRLGVVGFSLGGIVAHLAMGLDARLTAGVTINAGGDLPTLFRDSFEVKSHGHYTTPTADEIEKLAAVDPVTYGKANRPRHVLMIQAARDVYVPPANARALWNALGRPPIIWTDTNHFAFLLAGDSLARVAVAYLDRVWSGHADDPAPLPHLSIPTLKIAYLYEFDGNSTPAVLDQFYSFAARSDHKSALHLDVGESGRGPVLALGATVNAYVDAGVLAQIHGRPVVPYVSLQLVF
jgi:dienelactone hydrolase